jgi:hypothetical protein
MSTTPPVTTLVDEPLEYVRYTVLTAPGQSLPDALGLPPDTRLIDCGICSPMTVKRGRKRVQVRR